MNKNQMIIGLSGNKCSGKSTAAAAMTGFTELSFAGPLKDAVRAIFGFSVDQVSDGVLKEVPDAKWGVSPRQVMQRFGTDLMRKYSDLVIPINDPSNIWLVVMSKRIADLPDGTNIVISDVRFQNEVEFVRTIGGVVVRIERPAAISPAADVHESEKLDFVPDAVVVNDSSPDELARRVIAEATKIKTPNAGDYFTR